MRHISNKQREIIILEKTLDNCVLSPLVFGEEGSSESLVFVNHLRFSTVKESRFLISCPIACKSKNHFLRFKASCKDTDLDF